MTPEIEKKRREVFRAQMEKVLIHEGYDEETVPLMFEKGSNGEFTSTRIWGAWQGFNAAMDAVEIQLPSKIKKPGNDIGGIVIEAFNQSIDSFQDAITATGLGLRIKD